MHRFISAVGRGTKRARDLSRDEARQAMGLIVDGTAEPLQIGAFLIGLRMKGEAAAELAGFVDAIDACSVKGRAPAATLDVDCHGDGHAGRATLLPAAACAAAALGVPILLRSDFASPKARHGLAAALDALGLDRARPLDTARAQAALEGHGIAVLDLGAYCPPLARLVALRSKLGLRSAAQTVMKLVDPMGAGARLVGVFHAPYLTQAALALAALGVKHALCVQALGGLPEAQAGRVLRIARAERPEPTTLDFRSLASPTASPASDGDEHDAGEDASARAIVENQAALEGREPAVSHAAAAAALLVHAARGDEPLAAAAHARETLADGRAQAIAERLRRC